MAEKQLKCEKSTFCSSNKLWIICSASKPWLSVNYCFFLHWLTIMSSGKWLKICNTSLIIHEKMTIEIWKYWITSEIHGHFARKLVQFLIRIWQVQIFTILCIVMHNSLIIHDKRQKYPKLPKFLSLSLILDEMVNLVVNLPWWPAGPQGRWAVTVSPGASAQWAPPPWVHQFGWALMSTPELMLSRTL